MISKKEFDLAITTEAINYAHESIMDPENHQDAVEMVKCDFIEGAKAACKILKNSAALDKETFVKIMNEIRTFNSHVDTWCDLLKSDLFETPLIQTGWTISNLLINTHFDEEGQDWINWWLYEKDGNLELKAWDENDNEIPTETIDDLWNIVKDHLCIS